MFGSITISLAARNAAAPPGDTEIVIVGRLPGHDEAARRVQRDLRAVLEAGRRLIDDEVAETGVPNRSNLRAAIPEPSPSSGLPVQDTMEVAGVVRGDARRRLSAGGVGRVDVELAADRCACRVVPAGEGGEAGRRNRSVPHDDEGARGAHCDVRLEGKGKGGLVDGEVAGQGTSGRVVTPGPDPAPGRAVPFPGDGEPARRHPYAAHVLDVGRVGVDDELGRNGSVRAVEDPGHDVGVDRALASPHHDEVAGQIRGDAGVEDRERPRVDREARSGGGPVGLEPPRPDVRHALVPGDDEPAGLVLGDLVEVLVRRGRIDLELAPVGGARRVVEAPETVIARRARVVGPGHDEAARAVDGDAVDVLIALRSLGYLELRLHRRRLGQAGRAEGEGGETQDREPGVGRHGPLLRCAPERVNGVYTPRRPPKGRSARKTLDRRLGAADAIRSRAG